MSAVAVPAPTTGWNARDSYAQMEPTDAIELINLIPAGRSVVSRPGYSSYSSALGAAVQTIVAYHGTTEKLLCATPTSILDMTSGSTGTTLGSSFSVGKWQTCEFNNYLILVNGTDAAQRYDGTSLVPVAIYTVGADLVTNGTMAVDANWTKGTGWTIAAGVASSDGTQTASAALYQSIGATAGLQYEVTYTITARSAGDVVAYIGATGVGTSRNATGTYTEIITSAGSSPANLYLWASADFVGSIDNVTAKLVTANDYISCTTHKGRVYYIEAASQSFWYPAAGAYSGTLTEFDLSQFTTTGGSLLYMISWSRDGGAGVDDLAAFVFDTGEIIVYAGSDPADATDWSMLGRFQIGPPLGQRSAIGIGGDVIILTQDGYVPLSACLQEGRYSEQSDFSFKIDSAVKDAAQAYKSKFGWEAIYWPQASLFIVNVPISAAESHQHVRNTTTGGWCKFENLPASCWAIYSDNLYFGSPDGYVYKVAGSSDNGSFINFEATTAFSYLGNPHRKKQIVAVEPITDFSYPKYIDSRIHADFSIGTLPDITAPPESASSDWDVATWDVSSWVANASGGSGISRCRKNVTGQGYALAHTMRWQSKSQTTTWYATHYWVNEIGNV